MIQNKNSKICANCKFFIPYKNKCVKFGDVNIITGKENYSSAKCMRNDESKCGIEAVLFEENHYKFITVPFYFIVDNPVLSISAIFSFFSLFLCFYTLRPLHP